MYEVRFTFLVLNEIVIKKKDVDFLEVQKYVINLFESGQITVEGKTCEDISDLLYMNIARRWQSRDIAIEITDESKYVIKVVYTKSLPSLIEENKGIIVEGRMGKDNLFIAEIVLAKHDG